MTPKEINVIKRNGRGKEPLNIDKIHSMVGYATQDITGVSASHVEMNSGIQFYDGITTDDIQQILIKSANDLISLENPNYQYVAARLLLFSLRKNLYHRLWEHPKFIDQIKKCIKQGVYNPHTHSIYFRFSILYQYIFIIHTLLNTFFNLIYKFWMFP